MSIANLQRAFDLADDIDQKEGVLAYHRYNYVMRMFANHYRFPIKRVTAVFCALSPNSDYFGNLRSMASVLDAQHHGLSLEGTTVSTYNHCRDRAWRYLNGSEEFVNPKRGLKILSFYHNICDPDDNQPVTVDGHIHALWQGKNLTMKEAVIGSRAKYREIADAMRKVARKRKLLPNQVQATMWFARKRTKNIKYEPQLDFFAHHDDMWRIVIQPENATPYPRKD